LIKRVSHVAPIWPTCHDKARGNAIASGHADDSIAYGVPFVNPDLVERYKADAINEVDSKSPFYGGTAKGYTRLSILIGSTRLIL
jgi:N-ethylmaleimide reductase